MKKIFFLAIFNCLLTSKVISQNYTITSGLPISEIAGTGTTVTMTNSASSAALPIGFSFNFWEDTYTDFYINPKGAIQFGSGSSLFPSFSPSSWIPSVNGPNNFLAFGWLLGSSNFTTANVNYFVTGTEPNRVLVVNFKNVIQSGGAFGVVQSPMDVQIQLYEGPSGKIEIHNTNNSAGTANGGQYGQAFMEKQIGIENIDGTIGALVPGLGLTEWNVNNTMIRMIYDNTPPNPAFVPTLVSTPVCLDGTYKLTAGNCNGTLNWNNSLSAGTTQNVIPTIPTIYKVTCSSTGYSKSILLTPYTDPVAPTLTKNINTTINPNDGVLITATGCNSPYNIIWDDNSIINPRTVNPENTTIYSARCQNTANCNSPIANTTINVNPSTCPQIAINVENIPSIIHNGVSYFAKTDPQTGVELWRGDVSGNNAVFLKDINLGSNSSNPNLFFTFNNEIFFTANDGNGDALWKTNGTTNGTVKIINVKNRGDNNGSTNAPIINGYFYFNAYDFSINTSPVKLYKSDGTAAGTSLVSNTSYPDGFFSPRDLLKMGDNIYFAGSPTIYSEYQLYKLDGTQNVISKITNYGTFEDSYFFPDELTELNGILYFRAGSSINRELWRSDGTTSGTYLIKEINTQYNGNNFYGSAPNNFLKVNGILYFEANDFTNGAQLWRSDGTSNGTYRISNFSLEGTTYGSYSNSYRIRKLFDYGGSVYFFVNDNIHGYELWKSDGTLAGTSIVKDIYPGVTSSTFNVANTKISNGLIIFTANDGVSGEEIWRSDGTSIGTSLMIDTYQGATGNFSESLYYLRKVGNKIFYNTSGPTNLNNWLLSNGNSPSSLNLSSTNNPTDDISSGFINKSATNTITATNKITGTANVTYQAKSIELNNGFKADNGVVFKAEVGGCQ